MVIPNLMRQEILENLHQSHMVISKSKQEQEKQYTDQTLINKLKY